MMECDVWDETRDEKKEDEGARRESATDSGRGVRGADPAAANDCVCGRTRKAQILRGSSIGMIDRAG